MPDKNNSKELILTEVLRQGIAFATKKLPFGSSILNGFIYELLGIAPKEKEDKITPALKELNDKIGEVVKQIADVKKTIQDESKKQALNRFDESTTTLLTATKDFSTQVQALSQLDVDYPPYQIQLYALYHEIANIQIEGNGYVYHTLKIGKSILPSVMLQNKGILETYQEVTNDKTLQIGFQNYVLGIYLQAYGISMLYLNFKYDEESPIQQAGVKSLMDDLFLQMQQINTYTAQHIIS